MQATVLRSVPARGGSRTGGGGQRVRAKRSSVGCSQLWLQSLVTKAAKRVGAAERFANYLVYPGKTRLSALGSHHPGPPPAWWASRPDGIFCRDRNQLGRQDGWAVDLRPNSGCPIRQTRASWCTFQGLRGLSGAAWRSMGHDLNAEPVANSGVIAAHNHVALLSGRRPGEIFLAT